MIIARTRQESENELSHRKKMKSKYSRAVKILDSIRHSLNSSGIILFVTPILLTTVVGDPIAIISDVGAGLSTAGGILLLPIKRKLSRKRNKHKTIGLLVQDRYHKIRKHIFQILGDGEVSKEK